MKTFKHSGHIGDIIYSLPFVKAACEKYKTSAIFYINKDVPIPTSYDGPEGPRPAITTATFEFIKPLLEAQPYIGELRGYRGSSASGFDFDLDNFRRLRVNYALGHLPLYYMQMYKIYYDYASPWLSVRDLKPDLNDKIVIGRSCRNMNPELKYDISDAYFVGLDSEFQAMKPQINNLQRLHVSNAYETACAIASCKLFIGNSSFNFAVAEGLKKNRIFEMTNIQSLMPCGNVKYFTEGSLRDLL